MFVNGKTLVRTRFAPSPTGYLHIGGVRTALFNYLYAKRYGGSFVLRIDDTDRLRNVEFAVKPILDGLQWLGIDWDEGPIYQSSREAHYKNVAEGLIMTGNAYPDPPNQPKDDRRPYRGINRNMSTEQAMALYDDTGWSLRFRVETGEKVVLDDLIRGEVSWDTDRIGDPVILRADGTPTYNFATVVDDAEMKITHVIRAEEHLSNTPVQLLISHALGHVPPFYAHLPFVCEPGSNKKLSKRDMLKFMTPEVMAKLGEIGFGPNEIANRDELNPVILAYYQCLGYKPGAIVNYLARLGWSLDGTTELMTMEDLKKNFSIERVTSGPARFDPKKMLWMAGEYTKEDSLETRTRLCMEYLVQAKLLDDTSNASFERVKAVVELCGERIKVYSDILQYGAFFFRKPKYNLGDVQKYLTADVTSLVELLSHLFKKLSPWDAKTIGSQTSAFMEIRGLKLSTMVFALRVAISGNMIGPSLFHAMELLGKEECLKRLETSSVMTHYVPMEFGEG